MPHKHTRRDNDVSQFDLPPSQIARPLPVNRSNKHADVKSNATSLAGKKRKAKSTDDTPRAFKRLMAFAQGKATKSGLDDGKRMPKTQQAATGGATSVAASARGEAPGPQSQLPTIRPGERFSDFAARVDQALPLSGLVTKTVKDGKDPTTGIKVRRTRKEKKMHKLYDQWRVEDRKIKEQRQEAIDEETERQIDEDLANGTWRDWTKDYGQDVSDPQKKTKKKKKKKKKGRASKTVDDDPWKEFDRKHAEPRAGPHDVVQAPPDLRGGPGTKLRLRDT